MLESLQNKKIVFFGTPSFTVDFLDLFKSLNLKVVGVVTGEDKPVGRGMQMQSPIPKKWAEENGIPFFQPKKLDDDFYKTLKDLEADLFIVIAYGKIIPEKFINTPEFGTINLHYSLLPKYRGASPVESAILAGDTETGITIQQMAFKLDSGNILFQERLEILDMETTKELRAKLNKRALEIFPEFLQQLFGNYLPLLKGKGTLGAKQVRGILQDESKATFCGKFKKEDFDVTKEMLENNLNQIYLKYKAFDKKIYFMHQKKVKPLPASGHLLLRSKCSLAQGKENLLIIPYNKNLIETAKQNRNNPTEAEYAFWFLIKEDKTGFDFTRQKVIGNFIIDYYCNDLKLGIEIDGNYHENKKEYDLERQKFLESNGIEILRFRNEEVPGLKIEDLKKIFQKRNMALTASPGEAAHRAEGVSTIRIKITDMDSEVILKVLPESKKEILYTEFLLNY